MQIPKKKKTRLLPPSPQPFFHSRAHRDELANALTMFCYSRSFPLPENNRSCGDGVYQHIDNPRTRTSKGCHGSGLLEGSAVLFCFRHLRPFHVSESIPLFFHLAV